MVGGVAKTNDSLAENPFSVLSPAQTDSADSDTASEADESVFAISALDDHQCADLEQRYAHMWLYSKLYVYHVNSCLSPVNARHLMQRGEGCGGNGVQLQQKNHFLKFWNRIQLFGSHSQGCH